jgi:hypothetical protein
MQLPSSNPCDSLRRQAGVHHHRVVVACCTELLLLADTTAYGNLLVCYSISAAVTAFRKTDKGSSNCAWYVDRRSVCQQQRTRLSQITMNTAVTAPASLCNGVHPATVSVFRALQRKQVLTRAESTDTPEKSAPAAASKAPQRPPARPAGARPMPGGRPMPQRPSVMMGPDGQPLKVHTGIMRLIVAFKRL